MRHFTRPLFPVLILFFASAMVAHAQTRGGTGTGGGTGFGGGGSGGTGSGGSGGSSMGSSGGGLGFGGGGLGGGTGTGAGSATGTRGGASGSGVTLSQSNFLSTSYVGPYVTGNYTNSTQASSGTTAGNITVGAQGTSNSPKLAATFFRTVTFGQPLYNISTSGQTRGGTATIRSGTGGNTGNATATGQGDIGPVISTARAPMVATVLKFAATPKDAGQMTGDIKDLLQRSSIVTSKNSINVQVADRIVRLTGTVSTQDERRHVEALVRLAPGVRDVANELQVK